MISNRSALRFPWGAEFRAISAACLVCGIGYLALKSDRGDFEIFGRLDVLVVSVFSAVPISVLMADQIARKSKIVRFGLVALLALIVVSQIGVWRILLYEFGMSAVALSIVRGALAVITMTLPLACLNVFKTLVAGGDRIEKSSLVPALFVVVAVSIPGVYVDSVSKTLASQLRQSLSNDRPTVALGHARRLSQLRPQTRIDGLAIVSLLDSLDDRIDQLNAIVRRPISPTAPTGAIAMRVTSLVQLELFDQALVGLKPLLSGERFHPASLDVYGLCFQRLGDPESSLVGYQMAIQYWTAQIESNQKRQSLASAWKGIAFAARQLDQRSMEEHAYQQLLNVAPNASNCLLMAKCYKHHQKMDLAAKYASQAFELDPASRSELDSITSELARDHFGCLSGVR
ncbi:tetratricopeptide repeat protein [Rubripirellula reticaptiva]|uniref:Tetratricopeptide repeat protein n=1 Tax=Rubripirellula reticaptiva TaxID=2528013 RepID=A0A5C6EKV5_9BACT|nr:tetratricopeptide repeat protein [Rubripirellula reticaptiva]TWU48201.1 hypothetical protein Poly59_50470 [Rubripirellula reticaptiva]